MPVFFSSERALTIASAAIPQVAGCPTLVPLQLSGVKAVTSDAQVRVPELHNLLAEGVQVLMQR